MSLVNNMLRDLEERQSPNVRQVATASAGLSQPEASNPATRWALTSGVVLMLGAVGVWGWQANWWQSDTTPIEPKIAATIKSEAPELTPVVEPISQIDQAVTTEPEPARLNTTEPKKDKPYLAGSVTTSTAPAVASTVDLAHPVQPLEDTVQPLEKAKPPQVAPSAASLDASTVASASNWLQQGNQSEAERVLMAHLSTHPQAPQTSEALAQLYLTSGQFHQLADFIGSSSALDEPRKNELLARAKIQQGDLPGARDLLEQIPPAILNNPGYHALLAGVYHKLDQHREAATIYNQLVTLQPEQYVNWLGLAVALDALQDKSAALRAFEQAQRSANVPADVLTYIKQRVAMLGNGSTG